MLSTASSGSASDSTKTNPSFSIASFVIGTLDHLSIPVPAIGTGPSLPETTIGGGAVAPDISHALIGAQGGFVFTQMNVTVGNSGGSTSGGQQLRPNDSLHTIRPKDTMTQILQTNFDPTNSATLFALSGQGYVPSANGSPPETQIVGTTGVSPGTHKQQNVGKLVVDHPEVFNSIIPQGRAEIEVAQNSILVQDENTGMYIVGPTDAFTFTLNLVA